MTDYECGFSAGEQDAWKGRGHPLPKPPPEMRDERTRGFWDARLPRNATWARQRRTAPAQWDVERERYVAGKVAA